MLEHQQLQVLDISLKGTHVWWWIVHRAEVDSWAPVT